MALDTRNRRASIIGLGLAAFIVLPAPDGTITQPDRQHLAGLYAGIAAADSDDTVTPAERTITVSAESRVIYVRGTL